MSAGVMPMLVPMHGPSSPRARDLAFVRQFIVGPHPVEVRPDWRTLRTGRLVLTHCPTLPVRRITDARGRSWTLIGIAIQTNSDGVEPLAELADSCDVEATSSAWAGRWLLIGNDSVITDAAATLSCFYRSVKDAAWLSSSVELLRRLVPCLAPPTERLRHTQGIDWYPPPSTGIEHISRLLPSQRLVLEDNGQMTLRHRPLLLTRGTETSVTPLSEIADRLQGGLRFAQAIDAHPWLGLSGGLDSRLVLAASVASGLRPVTFTLEIDGMSQADRSLPPQLAETLGLEHVWIPAAPVNADRLHVFDEHTGRHLDDVDRVFFATGQLSHIPAGALVLGGGIFELGRCYYHSKLPARMPPTAEAVAAAVVDALGGGTHQQAGALEAWARWITGEGKEARIDWRDRLYWEQRAAGWVGSVEQGLDIAGFQRIHIANCRALIGVTLEIDASRRRIGAHQLELIAMLEPRLARFPVNPPDSRRPQFARRIARELQFLRSEGGLRPYVRSRAAAYRVRRDVHQRLEQTAQRDEGG